MPVFKYPIPIDDKFDLMLPVGAALLSVQVQHDTACIWALVDANAPRERRSFTLYGTGRPCQENPKDYIGSFQVYGGSLVFHLFEPSVPNGESEVKG